jgi:type IV pilus assembly protein PilC
MISYVFTAKDPATGKKITSKMSADSERAVVKAIKDQGYSPIEIKAETDQSGFFSSFKGKVKAKDRVIFSRQLSTLINAGLPLVQSLRTVLSQTKNKTLQLAIGDVITSVEGGLALSVALSHHPKIFNQVFVSLIAAGEASGTLDVALERIANQQEKDAEIISKVRGAMVYPIIVLLVMGGVVAFMIVSVLPQVEELYKGIPNAKLPFLTTALLAISHFMIKFWWVMLLIFVLGIFITTKWARTLGGRRYIDTLKMKAWPVGQLFTKMYMARFSRTGTTLVASGVPLIQVLDITAKAINNVHLEASINRAIDKVKGGKSLSNAIENDQNFLDLVPQMLKIGEDSGQIEQMMSKTADYFEKEVDNQIKSISTIIEPVLMIVLGVVAIIIVAAILLPIYGLVGQNIVR